MPGGCNDESWKFLEESINLVDDGEVLAQSVYHKPVSSVSTVCSTRFPRTHRHICNPSHPHGHCLNMRVESKEEVGIVPAHGTRVRSVGTRVVKASVDVALRTRVTVGAEDWDEARGDRGRRSDTEEAGEVGHDEGKHDDDEGEDGIFSCEFSIFFSLLICHHCFKKKNRSRGGHLCSYMKMLPLTTDSSFGDRHHADVGSNVAAPSIMPLPQNIRKTSGTSSCSFMNRTLASMVIQTTALPIKQR